MGKRKNRPIWIVSEWLSDADKRGEVLLTLIIVCLVAALLWPR